MVKTSLFLVYSIVVSRDGEKEHPWVQIMAWHRIKPKLLSKPMLDYCRLEPYETNLSTIWIKVQTFQFDTRPTLQRRKTLRRLRSINPNTINHFASQSQTCQLLEIKMLNGLAGHYRTVIFASSRGIFCAVWKVFLLHFFKHWKEIVKSGAISSGTGADR